MIDEAKFFAWLDGELSEPEASEVERMVAADPDLQRQADDHRALAAGLRRAFDRVSETPSPPHLVGMLQPAAHENVLSFSDARERHAGRSSLPIWKQVTALAATLVLGIFAGSQLAGDASSSIQTKNGRLVAAAELESALHARLASAPLKVGPRIGLTFRDRSGAICRTFEDQAASGLACREGDEWRIEGLFQDGNGTSIDYRMASGADPRLLDLVDQRITGDPFDAGQEEAAQRRGWR